MVYTRLDLTHAISVVNRFMAGPGKEHVKLGISDPEKSYENMNFGSPIGN